MATEDNGGIGNSTITPQPDGLKQGASYGYPGLRTGTDATDIKPKTGSPVNNKSAR